jgi:hypothetical protein
VKSAYVPVECGESQTRGQYHTFNEFKLRVDIRGLEVQAKLEALAKNFGLE